MKNSNTFLAILFFLFSFQLTAQNGVEKTFSNALPYETGNTLFVDLDGTVEVKEWKEDYIKVVVKITTNLDNEEALHLLVENKRYAMETEIDQYQNTTISHLFLNKIITVNNRLLEENMEYQIFVPDYTAVQLFHSDAEMMAQLDRKKRTNSK